MLRIKAIPWLMVITIIVGLLIAGSASATIFYFPSQSTDFDELYNLAQPGDTIFIEAGTHTVTHDLQKSSLTILGAGIGNTIMYNSYFAVTTPDTCMLIKNISFDVHYGPSILIYQGCTVDSCEFYGGDDCSGGGVIDARNNYIIRDCLIHNNSCKGIRAAGGGTVKLIEHNWFHANTAVTGGAIEVVDINGPMIRYNVFSGNSATDRGGAIRFHYTTISPIVNNTFASNSSPLGSAIWFAASPVPDSLIRNNIFAYNSGSYAIYNGSNPCVFGNCNAYWANPNGHVGNWYMNCGDPSGINNCIVADPLFCNAPAGDYSLDTLSPCLVNETCGQIGALGAGCSDLEYISTPSITGPISGIPWVVLWFTAIGAESSEGHSLEYQWDWDFHEGPNDPSPWTSDTAYYNQYPSEGTYNIRVHARCQLHPERISYWSEPHTVTIGYTEGSIAGVVTDYGSGLPITGAHVVVTQGGSQVGSDYTNTSGQYSLSGLSSGFYDVEASAPGWYTQTEYGAEVIAGQTTVVDFVLELIPTSGTISGTVTDAATAIGIEEVLIKVLDGQTEIGSTYTNQDGDYVLNFVPAGVYDVEATAGGYLPQTEPSVAVIAGDITTVNFSLVAASPPTAIIDYVVPQHTIEGFPIRFSGHGEDINGEIAAYEWSSPFGTVISNLSEFMKSDFSIGEHVVFFRVQDNDEEWSETKTRVIDVYEIGALSREWILPDGDILKMATPYSFFWYVQNLNSDPGDVIDLIYGLDQACLTSVPNFLDSVWLFPDAYSSDHFLYNWGSEELATVAGSEQNRFRFYVWYHWDWIEPWGGIWDWVEYCLVFVGPLAGQLENFKNIMILVEQAGGWTGVLLAQARPVCDLLNMKVDAELEYWGLGNSDAGTPYSFTFVVSQEKINQWQVSVGLGMAASVSSLAAVASPWLLIAEVALLAGSDLAYLAAYDPDQDYDQYVQPEFIYPAELDSISDAVERKLAYDLYTALGYIGAMSSSFIKYQGALLDENSEWAVKQQTAFVTFSREAAALMQELPAFMDSVVVPPTPDQIDSMQAEFAVNGLPAIEQSMLLQLGYVQEAIDSIGATFAALADEYYYATDSLPEMLRQAINDLDSIEASLSALPDSSLRANMAIDPDTVIFWHRSTDVSCWLEFPDAQNLTYYVILSAVMNDSLTATSVATTPGDYDGDGIHDFALDFTLQDVELLNDGAHLLNVSGEIQTPEGDTVFYAGSALLTTHHDTYICGDANGDVSVNISDAVSMIAYIFSGGPGPQPYLAGDANCDSTVNISDAVYLIAYIFAGGAAPCALCP